MGNVFHSLNSDQVSWGGLLGPKTAKLCASTLAPIFGKEWKNTYMREV